MTTEKNTIYGTEVRTICKVVKFDETRSTEFGEYENVLIVPMVFGKEVDDLDVEMGIEVSSPEETLLDSENIVKIGTTDDTLKNALKVVRERLDKRDFANCYAYVKGTVSESSYKDGRKFVNFKPSIISDISGKDKTELAKKLQKANALWDGVFRSKESVTKSATTSETFANAWD